MDEVKALLEGGIASEDLIYYGLEYKYLTLYATGVLSFDDMFRQLETAIHQFAKRQMTWFRGMERRGFTIHWLDARMSTEEKLKRDGMRYETIWKAVKSYLIMFSRRGSALWSGWRGRWPITVIEPL